MAPRARTTRIYTRTRNGVTRYYADFRDYSDVGGKQEALIPAGSRTATTNHDIAKALAAARLKELEQRRRNKNILGIEDQTTLAEYVPYHLEQKKRAGRVTDQWLGAVQKHLETAISYFCYAGKDLPKDEKGRLLLDELDAVDLAAVGVADVQRYDQWLSERSSGRKGSDGQERTLGGAARRQYLDSLSNLYRRAAGEGFVPPGYNPVAAMLEKPTGSSRREAEWLEIHEMALFLEATRYYKPQRLHMDPIPPERVRGLIATYALTGGRDAEVRGLTPDDVSFDRRTVTFRPTSRRRLKTKTSWRSVPLWPQLEEILRPYLFGGNAPPGDLLFPSPWTGGMIKDLRKVLDTLAEMCGWKPGEIRSKMFRHTYCAARLQTADRILKPGRKAGHRDAYEWVPVSPFTVGKEMGHGGQSLVQRVYGHLGEIRHRSEVVEYRVEQHENALAPRLAAVRATVR